MMDHAETREERLEREQAEGARKSGEENAQKFFEDQKRRYRGNGAHVDNGDHTGNADDPGRRPAASKQLVALAAEYTTLWHDSDARAYASLPVDEHTEHWPLRSRGFRSWLARKLWESEQRAAPAQAMQDALTVLEGMAIHDGAEHKVHVRLAERGESIYLDLADDQWRCVQITCESWHVVDNAPVRFERRHGMKPLPIPREGGSLERLREFINVTDNEWPLVLASLVGSFNVSGPHAVTSMSGEQGSGKSTNCRALRRVIDPNEADLRSAPRETRDLMIASRNGWICAFDNLSELRPAMSDDLARLATGAGFGTRQLYSDDEETLIRACRPVLCNGISDVVTRPDLLDRALVIRPPRITDKRRMDERTFWRDFDEALPGILGALLDAVSMALRRRDHVELDGAPRMADFARWVVAAEPGLPIKPGAFLAAYESNRLDAQDLALDADPVAQAIAALADKLPEWTGKASELADKLMPEKPGKTWPDTGQKMSGAIRRAAPTLRAHGYEVTYNDSDRPRTWTIRKNLEKGDGSDESDEARAKSGFQTRQSPGTSRGSNGKSDGQGDGPKPARRASSVSLSVSSPSDPTHSHCFHCAGEGCSWCVGAGREDVVHGSGADHGVEGERQSQDPQAEEAF